MRGHVTFDKIRDFLVKRSRQLIELLIDIAGRSERTVGVVNLFPVQRYRPQFYSFGTVAVAMISVPSPVGC